MKNNKEFKQAIPEKLREKNLHILSVYTNAKTPILVKCIKCNYEWQTLYHYLIYLRRKHACPRCAGKLVFEDIQNLLKQNNLSFKNQTNKTQRKYNLICNNCNKEFSITHRHIKNIKCPNCAGLYEEKLKNITGIIYKITFNNGKVYIGQTIQNFLNRKKSHKRESLRTNSPSYDTKISKAIRKYGFETLKWEIIHTNIPWNQLNNLEIAEIKAHNSYTEGYNSTEGGNIGARNAHLAVKRYKKRIEKERKQKQIKEEKQIRQFEKQTKKQIKNFLKSKTENYEIKRMKESINRHIGGAKKYQNNTPDSSKYRGVCWDKENKKWKASIKHKKKKIHIGLFSDEIEAAKAYNKAALKYHGSKAKLNF